MVKATDAVPLPLAPAGYRVIVVTDGVCSSSDGGHDDLLRLYRKRFSQQIEAAESAEILMQWPPSP